jgi:protein TonB
MNYALPVLAVAAALQIYAEKPAPQITPPRILERAEPEYTEQAHTQRVEGSVRLGAQVDVDGRLTDIRVTKKLGYGLDVKAIECVQRWRFQPAMRNSEPVAVRVVLEINFRLL